MVKRRYYHLITIIIIPYPINGLTGRTRGCSQIVLVPAGKIPELLVFCPPLEKGISVLELGSIPLHSLLLELSQALQAIPQFPLGYHLIGMIEVKHPPSEPICLIR